MRTFRLPLTFTVVLAAVVSSLTLGSPTHSAAAAGCSPSAAFTGTTITWTGKAHTTNWDDANNWRPKTVPDANHTKATYANEYVCIGKGTSGKPATVTIAKHKSDHVAGIDISDNAQLTVPVESGLFLGSKPGDDVEASFVRAGSTLQLLAGTLGGNSPLTVDGTLRWTGGKAGKHKVDATQTSSECAFNPSLKACPGDTARGGGETLVAASGTLLVDGAAFGGAALSDGRTIDNFGTVRLVHNGFIAMQRGTHLIDEHGSLLAIDGPGGIYQSGKDSAVLTQRGPVSKDGDGLSVVGVPVKFGKKTPRIRVRHGGLSLQRDDVPVAKVHRAGTYGVGGCTEKPNQLCHRPNATAAAPQVVTIGASREAAAPSNSKFAVALTHGPAMVHGNRVLGRQADVTTPTAKTTHSTHLTFSFDATTKGLPHGTNAPVYRNKHRITVCHVHGLTAKNTSCVLSEKVGHGAGQKKDLTVIVISIQPNASWLVGS